MLISVKVPILELNGTLTTKQGYSGEDTMVLESHPENEDMLLLSFSGVTLGIDKNEFYYTVINCVKPYRREERRD